MDSAKLGNAIIAYIKSQGYKINALNVIYIEGVDPVEESFRLNDDVLDYWNDTRNVISNNGEILMSAIATTEPGAYYTNNPMNPDGAARIAFGQHVDAWEIGLHGRSQQLALVQCEPVHFYRDFNKDGARTGDQLYCDLIGMNQHTTSDAPDRVGMWSAGCLVGRYPSTHNKFMQLMQDSGRSRFTATVLDGSELHKAGIFEETK